MLTGLVLLLIFIGIVAAFLDQMFTAFICAICGAFLLFPKEWLENENDPEITNTYVLSKIEQLLNV